MLQKSNDGSPWPCGKGGGVGVRIPALVGTAVLLTLAHPLAAVACSGPGAHVELASNTRDGRIFLGLAVLCFAASAVVRRKKGRSLFPFVLLGLLFALYPLIPSPNGGDCGISYMAGNLFLGLAYAAVLAWQVTRRPQAPVPG